MYDLTKGYKYKSSNTQFVIEHGAGAMTFDLEYLVLEMNLIEYIRTDV